MPQGLPPIGAEVPELPPIGAEVPQVGVPAAPTFSTSNEKDTEGNAVVDPNTIGTFARHFGAQVNPLPLGQILPFPKALGGSGWDAPIKAAEGMLKAQNEVKARGDEAFAKGDYRGAAAHYLYWLMPVIGPVLDQAGNEMREGKVAAGLGDTAGLATNLFGPKVVEAAAQTPAAARMAARADQAATEKTAQVMSPSGSSKEIRTLGRQATQVAPDVIRETSAVTQGGLRTEIAGKLAETGDRFDQAYGAIPKNVGHPVSPILAKLQAAKDRLYVQGTGGKVLPSNQLDRAAALDQAMKELKGIGPFTNTDNLATLRQNWKEAAKDQFVPNVNPNYKQIRGTSQGWADAYTELQDAIVTRHPELAPINADYRIWKTANDVMTALEDRERVRPTVGRDIMARGVAAAAGGASGGMEGALIGAVVGPMLERGVMNLKPAMKIVVARQLAKIADAITAGKTSYATSLVTQLRGMVPGLTRTAAIEAVPQMASQPEGPTP